MKFCVDHQRFNIIIMKNWYNINKIRKILVQLKLVNYFTKIDIRQDFIE